MIAASASGDAGEANQSEGRLMASSSREEMENKETQRKNSTESKATTKSGQVAECLAKS